MNAAFVAGASALASCVGGALAGMFIARYLPKSNFTAESKDVIKVATAVIATLAALVVGLLISAAKGSFDTKSTELNRIAAQVILLDRAMADYGPETDDMRELLRIGVARAIAFIWSESRLESVHPDAIGTGPGTDPLQQRLLRLVPQNDAQRWLRSQALQLSSAIEETRWLVLQQKDGSIQWPFLAILVFWFAIIFSSFGLFAPHNGIVFAVLFACAVSVAAALYLIVQMDRPYSGMIQISSAPLRLALEQLGK